MQPKRTSSSFYLKRVATGVVASLIIAFFLLIFGGSALFGEFLLYETLPRYRLDSSSVQSSLMAMLPFRNTTSTEPNPSSNINVVDNPNGDAVDVFAPPQSPANLIGTGNIAFNARNPAPHGTIVGGAFALPTFAPGSVTPYIRENLHTFTYLRNNVYAIEPDTDLLPRHVDFNRWLNTDFSITPPDDPTLPTVLIFHVHSTEMFIDSDPTDPWTGIMGAGAYLQQALARYGIVAIHETGRFDIVNGRTQIMGAYERMEPVIQRILAENPSIQVVIDLHRDGVRGDHKFLTYVDGVPVARIMYVNGLSLLRQNGVLRELTNLPNPNLMDNMAFSFQMQMMSDYLFPGLNRRILLKEFRYSTHMRPKSLLVEVGNQNNTLQEAKNAMDLFARVLAQVVLP